MSEHPNDPADRPDPDEYSLAPDDPGSKKPEGGRPLKSIDSLMHGIDEDAASDERAAARSAGSDKPTKFDPATGKRKPKVLTEEGTKENPLKSDDGPIVAVGKLGWKAPAIVAATLFVVNMVLAVLGAERGEVWRAVGHELLHIPINIGLGVGALFALSRIAERPLGFWKGGLARVAAAVVAFHAVTNLDLDFGGALIVQWLGGAALYFALLWMTLRAALREIFAMAVIHFVLWGLVAFLFWLAPLVAPKAEPAQDNARPPARVDQVSPPAGS